MALLAGRRVGLVLLALVLLATSCAEVAEVGTNTVATRSVDLNILVVADEDTGPTGAVRRAKVTVSAGNGERFELVNSASGVGGTGEMWQASEWAGSTVALLTTGSEPQAARVNFEVEGAIDGPSAGAMMTVGVAAAVNGDSIDETVAMTGTINPDGTLGPVGGIPQKVQGASQTGIKTVLIPTGLRESVDVATGATVDVVALGEQVGVMVQEVDDIYAAYEVFTGRPIANLPEPLAEYTLSPGIVEVLRAKTGEWLQFYEEIAAENEQTGATDTAAQYGFANAQNLAAINAARAPELRIQGRPAAAYDAANNAAYLAALVQQLDIGMELYRSGGVDALSAHVADAGEFGARIDETVAALTSFEPKTVSDVATLGTAYMFGLDAAGLIISADELLAAPQPSEEDVAEAIRRYVFGSILLRIAPEVLEMGGEAESASVAADVDVAAVTDFFDQAADANLELFEAITVPGLTEETGRSAEAVEAELASNNLKYGDARAVEDIIARLEAENTAGVDLDFARLGASLSRYASAAELIATFYSLNATIDAESLETSDLVITPTAEAMFHAAEQEALRSAALFEANDVDPSMILAFREVAIAQAEDSIERDDGPAALDALNTMWKSALLGQMLVFYGDFDV